MKILSLDCGTKTGWSTGYISGVEEFAVKRGESPGMRFLKFRGWLSTMLEILPDIKVIIYEQAHHRGGAATACGVGMVTVVLEFAAQHNIETMSVHSGTLKKYATGKGNAGKPEMIAEAINRGYSPIDDNEADAQLMLEYAMEKLGIERVT